MHDCNQLAVDLNYDGFGDKVSMVQDRWKSRKVKRTLNNTKKKRGNTARRMLEY